MLGQASNPMLAQAEQALQAKVPQPLQSGLARVIHAGLTILYSPKLAKQLQAKIAATKDPASEAGQGAVRMVSNLYQQSSKTIPQPLLVPAAMMFAFEYLDMLAKAGKVQITPDLISQTTQATGDALMPLFGVTKQKLAQMIAAKGGGQAPAGAPPAAPAPGGIIGAQQGAM